MNAHGAALAALAVLVIAAEGCTAPPSESSAGSPSPRVAELASPLSGYTGPCDISHSCVAAYSMTRAMASAYTGALFELVRDSDGRTLDIPQSAARQADVSAATGPLGFCSTPQGASRPVHCYVNALFDQSGKGNHLYTFKGQQSVWDPLWNQNPKFGSWGIDCGATGLAPYTCAPPFYISPKYNLPVLFTPFPTGLADCETGSGSCTNGLPVGDVSKAVMAYIDNRQGSGCCGTNGLEEGLDVIVGNGRDLGPETGMMFAPAVNFGTTPNLVCSSADEYCTGIDLEGGAGTTFITPPFPNVGTDAGEVFIEGKYNHPTPPTQPTLVTLVNGIAVQNGVVKDGSGAVVPLPTGNQIRAGLAGDGTPVQEAVFEFAITSSFPSGLDDATLNGNVSGFYASARAAASLASLPSGSTSLGPGDLAALNNDSSGMEGAGANLPAPLPSPDMLYSRMFAGYSLRRLNASYTGPLVKLQRDDGQVGYFGANATGNALASAASTWCGGHTCTVAEWPCQAFVTPAQESTWSAAHDTSRCPTLVPGPGLLGPLVNFNIQTGQETLHFDATHNPLCQSDTTDGMPHYWSVAAVARQTVASSGRAVVVGMNGGNTQLGFSAGAAYWTVTNGPIASMPQANINTWHSLIGTNHNGIGLLYLDGLSSGPAIVGDASGGPGLCVGNKPFTGDIAEVTLSYDLTGAKGALSLRPFNGGRTEVAPDPTAYADANTGNVLFNNQELAWGFLNNPSGSSESIGSPSIFVQASGEADVAVLSSGNSLKYYHAVPGGSWASQTVAGPQTTFSSPSIFARPTGEIDIVAMGANNSLMYYYLLPGSSSWVAYQIAGALTTYSAPSIYVRAASPTGEADVVAQGADYTLMYYHATPGSQWSSTQLAGPLTTYSQPSIFVRDASNSSPAGEADIAVQGLNSSLVYYHSNPDGSWIATTVAPAFTTFSAPTVVVRTNNPANEADIVAQGPNNSLSYYYALPNANFTSVQVAGSNTTVGAPGFTVQATGEADIVAQNPSNQLVLYFATPPGGLNVQTLPGTAPYAYAAPHVFARATNPQRERDIVTIGPQHSLLYYYDVNGSGAWASTTIDGTGVSY